MAEGQGVDDDDDDKGELWKAAYDGNLQKLEDLLKQGQLLPCHFEWDGNPLRGLIEGSARPRIAEVLLRHYGANALLLPARCPATHNTLLHHAAALRQEKLAIALIRSLPSAAPSSTVPWLSSDSVRQSFLESVNNAGQTLLHIATHHLLSDLIAEILEEENLKVNIKNNENETAFDIIEKKCYECCIFSDWRKPWRVSMMLRERGAKSEKRLDEFEDEEDTMKELTAAQILITNEVLWNMNVNALLVVATLALTLVFAALFTVPQTLAPGSGDNTGGLPNLIIKHLQDGLKKNKPFAIFICSLTLANLITAFLIAVIVLTVTLLVEIRALLICLSWACLDIMGFCLMIAYLVVVDIYMGPLFTGLVVAFGIGVALFFSSFAFYFDMVKDYVDLLSNLLSMTLIHGCAVSLLLTLFPKRCVKRIIAKLCFES